MISNALSVRVAAGESTSTRMPEPLRSCAQVRAKLRVAALDAIEAELWDSHRSSAGTGDDDRAASVMSSVRLLFGAEESITSITEAGHDVAVLIELPVNGGGIDGHVGMGAVECRDALGAGE